MRSNNLREAGPFMKIAFYTLGCKVNQYETEAMREMLEAQGYTAVEADGEPDVFLLNSCTVTAESSRKTRQILRKYRRLLPRAITVLVGCMPQAFPAEAEALPEADIILGNRDAALVADALRRYRLDGQRIVEIAPHEKGGGFYHTAGFPLLGAHPGLYENRGRLRPILRLLHHPHSKRAGALPGIGGYPR